MQVYCVINTTFLIIWGPGLALRGPEGSMKRAVEGMLQERQQVYQAFGLGLFALMLAAIAYTLVLLILAFLCRCYPIMFTAHF